MTPSLLIVPDRYKASKLYSQIPDNGAGDFTVVRNTTATDVNALGLIESVAANVPRLDYTGGGCPGLLVEPAATNLALRSEEFNDVYWTKASGVISANNTIAPDGASTADKYIVNIGATGNSPIVRAITLLPNTSYTLSLFVKKSDYDTASIRLYTDETGFSTNSFNLASGTATSNQIQSLANGWFRVWTTLTTSGTVTNNQVQLIRDAQIRDGVAGIFVWGAQLETGSVATSYIPTVATTQTRNADVIVDTAVSGLIGQSQGTIYAEINLSKLTGSRYIIAILVNSTNYFAIRTNASNAFIFRYRNGGSETTIPSIPNVSNSSTGIFKLALAYQDGNYAAAVNGTVYPSTASGIFPSGTFETVDLSFTTPLNDRISAAAIYTTRLDNATLSQLTML